MRLLQGLASLPGQGRSNCFFSKGDLGGDSVLVPQIFPSPPKCFHSKSSSFSLLNTLKFFIRLLFWLCWFVATQAFLQLWQARATLQCSMQAFFCGGFSCCGAQALGRAGFGSFRAWAQWLWLPGFRAQAHQTWHMRPRCSEACGIFPDRGSNPCLLH